MNNVLGGMRGLITMLALAGGLGRLQGADAVQLVKPSERSKHFQVVNAQLELGGTLYAFVDIDGDAQKLASAFEEVAGQIGMVQPAAAPYLKQNYPALFDSLGLSDLKAIGLSSVPDGGGMFRNRTFLYMPSGRHGLLAGLGGEAGPFQHLDQAPADTDLYTETELDLPAVYATVKEIVGKIGGEKAATDMETSLEKAGAEGGFSALKLIQAWKGRTVFLMRLDPAKSMALPIPPAGLALPALSFLLRVDGIGPAVEGALAKAGDAFVLTDKGGRHIYALKAPLPVQGLQPVVVVEGGALYLASTAEFLDECLHPAHNLASDAAFHQALESVGKEGNGLAYVTPRLFDRLRDIDKLNPKMPEPSRRAIDSFLDKIPVTNRPLVMVRINRPDGILFRALWNRSSKRDVAMVAFYNPVTVGLLAAMAIPAFEKVRTASQEKAITNNLRQLDAAADQFYLEHNVTTATYDDLVGPDKYVKSLRSVVGEDYRQLEFKQGEPLVIRLPSGTVIRYPRE